MYFNKFTAKDFENIEKRIEDKSFMITQSFSHSNSQIEDMPEPEFLFILKDLGNKYHKNLKFINHLLTMLVRKISILEDIGKNEENEREIRVEAALFLQMNNFWNNQIKGNLEKKYGEKIHTTIYPEAENHSPLSGHDPINSLRTLGFKTKLLEGDEIKVNKWFMDCAILFLKKDFSIEKMKEISLDSLKRMVFYSMKAINNGDLFTIIITDKETKKERKIFIKADSIDLSDPIDNPLIESLINDVTFLFKKMQEMPTLFALDNGMYTKSFIRKMITLTEII